MVKFSFTDPEGIIGIGFGLSERNIELLKEGKPIVVELTELGVPNGKALIFYGKTELEMHELLKDSIGPDTIIHIDPRLTL